MFYVWWKRQDEWKKVFSSNTFAEALDYAENNIVHGHITQRIEVREATNNYGRAIYDSAWS